LIDWERLGGGWMTLVIQENLSAVVATALAGKNQFAGLENLSAAHVFAWPGRSILGLLPKLQSPIL
jgi:microcompartment protein CcmL/EutN